MRLDTLIYLLIILATLDVVYGGCPEEKIRDNGGVCLISVECTGSVYGARLPVNCSGSTNQLVQIDLIVTNVNEDTENIAEDKEFLAYVFTLRISGYWPEANLGLLNYMPRLTKLYVSNNQISQINERPFASLTRLEEVDLSHNNLTDIDDLFYFESDSNRLQFLYLSYNMIEDISDEVFSKLTSLRELDLSNNLITTLNEAFTNLTNLEILKLNNNRIRNLDGALNNLQELKHLYINSNFLEKIDIESLKVIHHLKTFDISHNNLILLEPSVFLRHWSHVGGKLVFKLVLSDNFITILPNATSKQISERYSKDVTEHVSTEVDLSGNNLVYISFNAFQTIFKLEKIDLSRNELANFEVNAESLQYVQFLNLSSNILKNLNPQSFYLMSNLQYLDLSNNLFYFVPEIFFNKFRLRYIKLNFNNIKKVQELPVERFHPDGGMLDLSSNGLEQFSIGPGQGKRLKALVLSNNNITDISLIDLKSQNDLKTLDLSLNQIGSLDFASYLPSSLINLDVNNNSIASISPAALYKLSHLRTLRVAYNNLTDIEYGAFQGLDSLINLDLSFNEISSLDSRAFLDSKLLRTLSVRYNKLQQLDYKLWIGHKFEIKVMIDGNLLSCEWLATALNNFNNGYSKMNPAVLNQSVGENTVEGIPCVPMVKLFGKIIDASPTSYAADERLVVINKNILEAVREQNYYLKRFTMQLFNQAIKNSNIAKFKAQKL